MRIFLTICLIIFSVQFFGCTSLKRTIAKFPSPNFKLDPDQYLYAVAHGDLKTVEYVLGNGIDPNYIYPTDDFSMLEVAFQENKIPILKVLLEYGANPDLPKISVDVNDVPTFQPRTEIYLNYIPECGNQDYEVDGEYLRGVSPLTIAVAKNNTELVHLLLKYGADPNLKTSAGNSILALAARRGNIEVIKSLLTHGANALVRGENDETALMTASADLVPFLIEIGIDINAQTYDGDTVLMDRVCDFCYERTKYLLERGAKINLQNHDGKTALMFAAGFKIRASQQFIEQLKQIENELRTEKNVARIRDLKKRRDELAALPPPPQIDPSAEVLQLLIKSGAEINLRDKNGKTALAYAEESKNQEKIKMILSFGGVH